MPHAIPAALLDEHGYPTDDTLDAIHYWSGTPQSLVDDLLDPVFGPGGGILVEAIADDFGRPVQHISLVTGGWSGCETAIRAIEHSMFGFAYWQTSTRGGLHTYKVPDAHWVTPMRTLTPRTPVLPEERLILRALMATMDCKVDSDTADCPSCGSAPCGPHGTYWHCEAHDWHETDNADGVCGYALMLTRAAINAPAEIDGA